LFIDMTCEFSEPDFIVKNTNYRNHPVLDGYYPSNVMEYYYLVEEAYFWNGPVYVHCAQGHGRSGAIAVLLVIMKGYAKTVDEAQSFLQKIRPKVHLHPNQRDLVEKTLAIWRDKKNFYV